jgi:hypothetical protein
VVEFCGECEKFEPFCGLISMNARCRWVDEFFHYFGDLSLDVWGD